MRNIDRQKQLWDKYKSQGKMKFILTYGVLTYSVMSIGLATFYMFVFNRALLNTNHDIVVTYLISLITWSLTGLLIGNLSWKNNIKKFEK